MSRKELIRRRELHETGFSTSSREVDKLIINVSSAILAISGAFIVAPSREDLAWLMIASWISFVLAIILVLVSFGIEQKERTKRIARIDKALKQARWGFHDKATATRNNIVCVNRLAKVMFTVGLLLILSFLACNLVWN